MEEEEEKKKREVYVGRTRKKTVWSTKER
jgi:hypothetical protein